MSTVEMISREDVVRDALFVACWNSANELLGLLDGFVLTPATKRWATESAADLVKFCAVHGQREPMGTLVEMAGDEGKWKQSRDVLLERAAPLINQAVASYVVTA